MGENDVKVSFYVNEHKYHAYRDACQWMRVNPAGEMRRHIDCVAARGREFFPGYQLIECCLDGKRGELSERVRLREIAGLCLKDNPDVIIYWSERTKSRTSFESVLRKNHRVIYQIDKFYSVAVKEFVFLKVVKEKQIKLCCQKEGQEPVYIFLINEVSDNGFHEEENNLQSVVYVNLDCEDDSGWIKSIMARKYNDSSICLSDTSNAGETDFALVSKVTYKKNIVMTDYEREFYPDYMDHVILNTKIRNKKVGKEFWNNLYQSMC